MNKKTLVETAERFLVEDNGSPLLLQGLSDSEVRSCLNKIVDVWFMDNGEFNIDKEHGSDTIEMVTQILSDCGVLDTKR